jgi:hypothetical protein
MIAGNMRHLAAKKVSFAAATRVVGFLARAVRKSGD